METTRKKANTWTLLRKWALQDKKRRKSLEKTLERFWRLNHGNWWAHNRRFKRNYIVWRRGRDLNPWGSKSHWISTLSLLLGFYDRKKGCPAHYHSATPCWDITCLGNGGLIPRPESSPNPQSHSTSKSILFHTTSYDKPKQQTMLTKNVDNYSNIRHFFLWGFEMFGFFLSVFQA